MQELLDRAFQRPLESMDLDARGRDLDVDGLEELRQADPRSRPAAPTAANEGELPSFDIDLELSAGGPGSTVSTGRLSTGDRAFVKFGDSFYEVDPKEVAAANRELDAERRRPLHAQGHRHRSAALGRGRRATRATSRWAA